MLPISQINRVESVRGDKFDCGPPSCGPTNNSSAETKLTCREQRDLIQFCCSARGEKKQPGGPPAWKHSSTVFSLCLLVTIRGNSKIISVR